MEPTERKPSLAILIAISAIGPMALNIFIPSMPGMRAVFGTDYAVIQLTLTGYLFAIAIAQIFLGPLSDRFGRRPVLLFGMILFIVGSLGCMAATTITELIIGRVVQATGGCAGLVLSRAIVRDLWDRDTSASMLGYITMAMVLAPMFAPSIGGYLDVWFDWKASFAFMGLLGMIVLGASWLTLHETIKSVRPMPGIAGIFRDFRTLLQIPLFRSNALSGAFAVAIFFSFLAGAPFIMEQLLGRSKIEYGLYFMLSAAGYMTGNYLSGRFSTKYGTDTMVIAGNLVAVTGAGLLVLFAILGILNPISIFLPMLIIGLSNGLTIPNTLANAVSVRPDMAGAASGLAGSLQLILGGLGTLIVGYFQGDSQWSMTLTMTGFALLSLIAGLFAIADRKRIEAQA